MPKNALDVIDRQSNLGVTYRDNPDFLDTVSASLAYKYDPIRTFYAEKMQNFPEVAEAGFSALDNIPKGYESFHGTLLRATNQQHMDFLVDQVDRSLDYRRTLADSSFMTEMLGEIVDPINLIAFPMSKAATFGKRFLQGGTAIAGVTAAQEAIRYPFDPLATPQEAALTVGSSFVLGGVLTGAVGVPMARRARAIEEGAVEIDRLRKALEPDGEEFDATIADNIFTDTWMYKAVSTPMKRTLQDTTIPNSVKLTMLDIANDNGLLLSGNRKGKALDPSVFLLSKMHQGELAKSYDGLLTAWGESTGKGVVNPADYLVGRKTFEQWVESVDRKVMAGDNAANDFEQRAMDILNGFYSDWEVRLREQGMIGDAAYFTRAIESKEKYLADLEARLSDAKTVDARRRTAAQIDRVTSELDEFRLNLEDAKQRTTMPANEEVFRPRFWNREAIRANRDEFERIIADWYMKNPVVYDRDYKTGKWARTELPNDPKMVAGRARQTTDKLLGLDGSEVEFFGHGRSNTFRHRTLDIPNNLVMDFIHTNPVAVMKSYTTRVAPKYEFTKKFGGRSVDDLVDEAFYDILENGGSVETAHKATRDIRAMYETVTHSINRDPDHWSHKTARAMRAGATLSYLGSAGISTITEPAKIMMEHGIGPTMRGLFSVLQDNQLKLGAKEGRIAGEGLETLMGSTIMRLVDDVSNNPLRNDLLDRAHDAFFLLNGLGPITRVLKDFDAMMRSHTLIDYSVRAVKGEASEMEIDYLARYGIDMDTAKSIANAPWQKSSSGMYMANTEAWTNTIEFPATTADIVVGPTNSYAGKRYKPSFYRESENRVYIDEDYIRDVMWNERGWENPRVEGVRPIEKGIINSPDDLVTFIKMHEIMHSLNSAKSLGFDKRTKAGKAGYENAINDLAVAEIKKQARVPADTVTKFRSALSSGIMNTILMGTPADKPIITNGVAFIPMRVAKQFGMKEDPKYRGYARIENGLLGLPFQFYSYTLAALNKITVAHAQGQLKNQILGTMIAMGLGYMLLQLKTPNYVEMSFQDQFARAFDYSGVASIYSDMFYTAMATSQALGGPNLTGGILQPRFPEERDIGGAVSGLAGAGPSYAYDMGSAMYDMLTGNVSEGSKDLIRGLPFARLWFLKGTTNRMTNALADTLEQTEGYGRF